MIYLDNAATTFPKPRRVVQAVYRCIDEYCGNPGRGSHALAMAAAEQIYTCREALCELLGAPSPERILFTQNTTYALNLAIKGLLKAGDHVLISELEHNAVRRPVCRLAAEGRITYDVFPALGLTDDKILASIRQRLLPHTRAIICTHASNICSHTLPIAAIGALCREKGLFFIVDAAQSAGTHPLNMASMHIDALAVPGHKALYGIQGCGALALSERLSLDTLAEGGSGINSLLSEMPADPPERYEAGTLPTPAIVGLLEGVRSLQDETAGDIAKREQGLFLSLRERLESLPHFTVYAPDAIGAVLLFNHDRIRAATIGQMLAQKGICVRAGLHCAPLAHQALGTPESGAVRISFGRYNTLSDVDALWRALKWE